MNSRIALLLAITSLILSTLACGEQPDGTSEIDSDAGTFTDEPSETEQARVDRLLGIDVNEAESDDFESAFTRALDVGIDFVSLSIYWDDFETSPGTYEPEINWLQIANSYYSAAGVDLSLVIAPIDTNVLHTPEDLRGVAFDDAEMIRRFEAFIDYTLGQLDSVNLVSISIGNEIDAYLGSDPALWSQYEAFYAASVEHLHRMDPEYIVGTKSMFDGLTQTYTDELASMNVHSDVILVTYYPLESDFSVRAPDTVFGDFERVTALYDQNPIYFLELGYPSSEQLGSSEERQAAFIENVFEAWDHYSESIRVINIAWLHDISQDEVDFFAEYYGLQNRKFLAFLGSLGLIHTDGTEKAAFVELEEEASARGW
mgnify:CR=1 FL=1